MIEILWCRSEEVHCVFTLFFGIIDKPINAYRLPLGIEQFGMQQCREIRLR